MLMHTNVELVPLQVWLEQATRKAVKLAARRAGLTMNQAGKEAWTGWLEWMANVEVQEAVAITRQYEQGALTTA
jgi:hypothetical protein